MKRKVCFVLLMVLICAQLLVVPALAAYLPGDTVVYITATGDCYHKKGCGYLRSRIETTLAEAVNDGYRPCSRCHPGRLDPNWQPHSPLPSPKPSPSPLPSPSPSKGNWKLALAGVFFLSAAAVSILYLLRSGKKQEERLDKMRSELHSLEKNEEEKNQKLKEAEAEFRADEQRRAFEKIKSELVKKYGQKPIEELCAMPQWVEIGEDGLPKERGAVDWGYKFTYYKSSSGKCAHKKRGCCGVTHPIHAWQIPPGTPLCSKCYKKLPDMTWYKEYLYIKQIKHTYHID